MCPKMSIPCHFNCFRHKCNIWWALFHWFHRVFHRTLFMPDPNRIQELHSLVSWMSWFFSTVDPVGSARQNAASHTHTFWQRKPGSLSLSKSKALQRGDWLLFLAAWKKRKLYVYFPLFFIWLWCCCGGSVLIVCDVCLQYGLATVCVCLVYLWDWQIVCLPYFFSSFNWKCNCLLLPNVWGQNNWKRKKRGKHAWLVCF